MVQHDTKLTPGEESQFQTWKAKYAPRDSGEDYDLRGAFKANLQPDPETGHWPDTFKKPNHPTFSVESQYATGPDRARAGRWEGETFIPPPARDSTALRNVQRERLLAAGVIRPNPPTFAEEVRSGLNAAYRAPMEMAGEALAGAARIIDPIAQGLGWQGKLEDTLAMQASQEIASFARNNFPSVEAVERAGGATRFFASTLPGFAGAGAAFLAGGEVAGALGLPGSVAHVALPMMAAGLSQGEVGYQDAKAHGADEDTAMASFALNAGVGAAGMGLGPIPAILGRANRTSGGLLSRALSGAAVGAGQSLAADLIAKQLYDDGDRGAVQKMLEAGAAGGLSTVLLEAVHRSYTYAAQAGEPPAPVEQASSQEAPVRAADIPADAPKVDVPVPAKRTAPPLPTADELAPPRGEDPEAQTPVPPIEPRVAPKAPEIVLEPSPMPEAAPRPPPIKPVREEVHPDLAAVLKPEDIQRLPPSIWPGVQNGKQVDLIAYHGSGRAPEVSVLAPGLTENVLGEGRYSAASPESASTYGPRVDEVTVTLRNPLVITSDTQLAELGNGRIPMVTTEQEPFMRRVRARIQRAGFDSVVIQLPEMADIDAFGQPNKRLRELFGSSQVVEFDPHRDMVGPELKPPVPGDQRPNPGQIPDFLGMPGGAFVEGTDLAGLPDARMQAANPVLGGAAAEGIGYGQGGLEMTGVRSDLEVPWNKVDVPSRQNIVSSYCDLLRLLGMDTEFRLGRMPGGSRDRQLTKGVFSIRTSIMRLASDGDISVAPHEFAHALEKCLYGVDMTASVFGSKPSQVPVQEIKAELDVLGKRLYGDEAPAHVVTREGFAEFVREWFNKPETVGKLAPKTVAWFEGKILKERPEVAAQAEAIRDQIDLWRRSGGLARTGAQIMHPNDPREKAIRRREWIKAISLEEAFIEVGKDLRIAQEMGAKQQGELPRSAKVFDQFDQLRMTAGSISGNFVKFNTTDAAGVKTGMSLKQALAPAKKGGWDLFSRYVTAKTAVSWWTDPLGSRDPGISYQDAQAALADIEKILGPEKFAGFEIAQHQFEAWQERVKEYCSQVSPTFASEWGKIQQADQVRQGMDPTWRPNYATLQRDMGSSGLKGYADSSRSLENSPLFRAEGSGKRVRDPIWQAGLEAERLVSKAHLHAVADAARQLEGMLDGAGTLLVRVPPDERVATRQKYGALLDKIQERLAQNGEEIDLKALIAEQGFDGNELNDILGESVAFFEETKPGPNGQPTIGLWNGKGIDYYEMTPGFAKAMTGMSPYQLRGGLAFLEHGLFQVPKQVFTMGTTGLRASFSLLTNPIRDVQTLYLNTSTRKGARELSWLWAKTMKNALQAHFTGKSVDPVIDLWRNLGGKGSLPLAQDTKHLDVALTEAFGENAKYRTIVGGWEFLKDFLQVPEMVTRVVEGKAVLEERGWKPGDTMTAEMAMDVALAMKRVSTNFAAAGEVARAMNRIAPFFNASIQGPYASWKAAKRSPGQFFLRGAILAANSAALWLVVKDQDWYKQLAPKEKYGYWHIPADILGQKTVMRIPMSHEVGLMFGALPMAMLDALNEQDPRAAMDWAQTAVGQTLPNVMPVLLSEALEQASNRDFYTGTPIVPKGQEDAPPEEQFGDYTTRASIALGRLFGWSPRRLDHMIRGTAGPAALDLAALSGRGREDRPFVTEAADLPVAGVMFQRGGEAGTQPRQVTDLYNLYGEYYARSKSERNPEAREDRARRLMLQDATQAISALSFVRARTTEFGARSKITEEMLAISKEALERVQGRDVYNRGTLPWKKHEAERAKVAAKR